MSVHASTFEIVFAFGVGEGVTEDFEDELDDPQALTMSPNIATTTHRPVANRTGRSPEMAMLGSLARARRAVKRSGCASVGGFEDGLGVRQILSQATRAILVASE